MELIKQIKQAEKQAQEIIEQAKTDAAKKAEKTRSALAQALEKAEHNRKKAIQAAVATAQSQGVAEIKNLKTRAENDRRQLRDTVSSKMATAVTTIVDCLKG